MKKLNNKGFALVETLIVSVFVMGIVTMLFTNYYPMIGEYEKRENYDDIDSVYKTYYIKNLIERNSASLFITYNSPMTPTQFCSKIPENDKDYCNNMLAEFRVEKLIYSTYMITSMKSVTLDDDQELKEYIRYLPDFSRGSNLKSRITVQYRNVVNVESGKNNRTIYRFSTIGVDG